MERPPEGPPPVDAGRAPEPIEPRQRWRLTFARDPVASDAVGRVALEAWQAALVASGLPVVGIESGGGRPKIAFGAPLPAMCRGEAELADIWLTERLPAWAIREALGDRMPPAHRWIRAEDIWLGAPALAGQVVAAEWDVSIAMQPSALTALAGACEGLLGAASLPRMRTKGATGKAYDLRPLLESVAPVRRDNEASPELRIMTRFDPALGAGRPEEVVAALAEALGADLTIEAMTRRRLMLAGSGEDRGSGRLD